jgi:hypothetical protein
MGHWQRLRDSLSALKRKGCDNDNEDACKQIKLSGRTALPTTRTEMVSPSTAMWESLRQGRKRSSYDLQRPKVLPTQTKITINQATTHNPHPPMMGYRGQGGYRGRGFTPRDGHTSQAQPQAQRYYRQRQGRELQWFLQSNQGPRTTLLQMRQTRAHFQNACPGAEWTSSASNSVQEDHR